MINLKTKYDSKKDVVSVNYSSKSSSTIEHIYAIITLLEKIQENDFDFELKQILKDIETMYISRNKKVKKVTKKVEGLNE